MMQPIMLLVQLLTADAQKLRTLESKGISDAEKSFYECLTKEKCFPLDDFCDNALNHASCIGECKSKYFDDAEKSKFAKIMAKGDSFQGVCAECKDLDCEKFFITAKIPDLYMFSEAAKAKGTGNVEEQQQATEQHASVDCESLESAETCATKKADPCSWFSDKSFDNWNDDIGMYNEKCNTVSPLSAFAARTWDLVEKQSSNYVCSPYSLNQIFALLSYGAGENTNTLQQFKDALYLGSISEKKTDELYTNLTSSTTTANELSIASKVWVRSGNTIGEAFKQQATQIFSTTIESVDEFDKTEINKFVADKTKGEIKDLFKEISNDTELVIVHAMYFKAQWKTPFELSERQIFTTYRENNEARKTLTNVPMMSVTTTLQVSGNYYEEDVNAVRIPFKSGDFAMVFIKPDSETSVRNMKLPTPEEQDSWPETEEDVTVTLPKFSFATNVGGLMDVAKNLGLDVTDAPDFSRLSKENGMTVSQIVQKAVVEVDDVGAKAAAATGIQIQLLSGAGFDVSVEFDRPFAFMIVDTKRKVELFRGYVENPLE